MLECTNVGYFVFQIPIMVYLLFGICGYLEICCYQPSKKYIIICIITPGWYIANRGITLRYHIFIGLVNGSHYLLLVRVSVRHGFALLVCTLYIVLESMQITFKYFFQVPSCMVEEQSDLQSGVAYLNQGLATTSIFQYHYLWYC